MGNDFDIGFSAEAFAGVAANDGTGYRRVPFGDYRVRIADGEIQPSKNAQKPHNMLKLSFEVLEAYDERNKQEVGSIISNLYGTITSPEYMQKRFKAVCEAIKVAPNKQGLKFSQLAGKELDITVVWELSDSNKIDEMGQKIFYVNDRVKAERPVGTARPKTLNPQADSQKAIRYLETSQPAEPGTATETAPWEAPANGAGASAASVASASSFLPESEIDPGAHEYRAAIRLGDKDDDTYREQLVAAGIDPDGPVDVAHLSPETKAQYEAKFGAKKAGLPPLGSGGKKPAGARQPRA